MLYRGFSTQEELDEQYNLRESVPDFPAYERFYKEQSQMAREQLECQLDVPFDPRWTSASTSSAACCPSLSNVTMWSAPRRRA